MDGSGDHCAALFYDQTQTQIAAQLGISQVQVSRIERKILGRCAQSWKKHEKKRQAHNSEYMNVHTPLKDSHTTGYRNFWSFQNTQEGWKK